MHASLLSGRNMITFAKCDNAVFGRRSRRYMRITSYIGIQGASGLRHLVARIHVEDPCEVHSALNLSDSQVEIATSVLLVMIISALSLSLQSFAG